MTNKIIIHDIDKGKFYRRFYFYQTEIEKDDYRYTVNKIREMKPLFFIRKGKKYIIASRKKLELQKYPLTEFKNLNDYTVFDMALRALAAEEYGEDFFSSRLFYVVKEYKSKIVCITFNLKNKVLNFGVKTFIYTSKTKSAYTYELKGNRIIPSDKKQKVYIQKSGDKKSSVDFIRFKKDDAFYKSKMFALYDIGKKIKQNFPEIEWGFEKVGFETCKVGESSKKKKVDKLKELFKNEIKEINIVNYTDESVEKLTEFLDNYGIKHKTASKPLPGYNITITKPQNEYEKAKDPYHKGETDETYLQNITDEVLGSMSGVVFETLLKELVIQKEIKTQKLLLPEHKPAKKFRFFEKINEEIYGVEIDREKLAFNIAPPEFNLEKGEFAMVMDDNVNVIKNTGMHLIFDLDVFDQAKEKDNLRNKKFGIIQKLEGIKFKNDLYAVGIVGNPQAVLKKGFPVRKIEVLKGAFLRDEILDMLKEFYIRYKNITVFPYPRKYIREYYKI